MGQGVPGTPTGIASVPPCIISTMGPDLLGVTERRDRTWLINWLRAPDKMLAEKDPIAMKLYAQFNNVSMPNMRLSQVDVTDLIRYLDTLRP